jgi:hypothetical protein
VTVPAGKHEANRSSPSLSGARTPVTPRRGA